MKIYDTKVRGMVELPPPPGSIGMYFCGPTVYQRIHVGNARPFILSMWLRRWLIECGYEVRLVVNITDINDKIYQAACVEGVSSNELATSAADWYIEDTDRLGLGRPDVEPRVTETLPEILSLIEELIECDLAYPISGDVYFRVRKFSNYGCLSGQRLDDLSEQEPNVAKEDPRDFALWKASKEDEDTSWQSPWGHGRPGWHIECSAMAEKHLGSAFQIHGGGIDLVFPHHENEVAQSCGAGRDFAKIWMHNGLLEFTGEKMSKSLGNTATLQAVLEKWGPEVVLLYFMTGLWRNPIDFSEEAMDASAAQVEGFRNAFRGSEKVEERDETASWQELACALDDNFNTAEALAIFHRWRSIGRRDLLRRGLTIFGLGALAVTDDCPAELIVLAEARETARTLREFARADELREEIRRQGWDIRDGSSGFELFRCR